MSTDNKSQRFEGRNLEEALTQASAALGVERGQMTYHVLLEKRGFLGGVKRVVIEADVNRAAVAPPAAAPAPAPYAPSAAEPNDAPAPREARPPRPAGGGGGGERGRGRGGRGGRGGGGGGNREARGGGGGGGRGRGRGRDRDLQSGDFEKFFADVPEQGPESEMGKVVRDWCEEVISYANLDLVVRTEENETQVLVRLYGADGRRLVDRHGELLDAIQVLANKALVGRKVEKEIELDCDSFKEKRNEDLAQQAREVADRVRKNGREELLPAMTPIERRIVHIALRDDADVTTESRGEGFYKRVAIITKPAVSETPAEEPADEQEPQPPAQES